jgi:hypothetical protein
MRCRHATACSSRRNETRSLRLTPSLRVKSGTGSAQERDVLHLGTPVEGEYRQIGGLAIDTAAGLTLRFRLARYRAALELTLFRSDATKTREMR